MGNSLHEPDSEIGGLEHDSCVSRREFRTLRDMVKGMADDVKMMMNVLMVSTPERGSMLDTQRKQDAEIALVRAEIAVVKAAQAQSQAPLSRRMWETAIITSVQVLTALALALLAKGLVISIVTEALKLAGGAK